MGRLLSFISLLAMLLVAAITVPRNTVSNFLRRKSALTPLEPEAIPR
jgi:hypothetical protein